MSKGVVATLEFVGAVAAAATGNFGLAAALASASLSTEMTARAEIKAKNAYNASLRDRYAMVRSTLAARQLVFGRCRVSGSIFFVTSYGTDNQNLVLCVALAAHEVDAIEAVYFNDLLVSLDGDGNVSGVQLHESFSIAASTATVTVSKVPYGGSVSATARYGSDIVPLTITSVSGAAVSLSGARSSEIGQLEVVYQSNPDAFAPTSRKGWSEAFTVVTGSDTFTLSRTPDVTGVHAVYRATSAASNDAAPVTIASVTGASVTISGATPGRHVVFYYETSTGLTLARVRKYLGAPGQAADSPMQTELPGVWTSAHTASGVAYLVVECTYDQNAYVGGMPNVSAVVRGMKCFDPRTSTTAWTENPALHARALATHPLGGRLPAEEVDDASIASAANVSDVSTAYTVGGVDFVRPLYTAGYLYTCDRKPMDGITDLCQAMGGDRVYADGKLRIWAGSYNTPNPGTLDETWLVDSQAVQVQVGIARADLINTVTSSIADQFQEWRVVPLDQLSPADYVAADGAVLSRDVQYAAITFAGQAQYVASCLLRRMRQGLTVTLVCNMRAWTAERFDVLNVSLARFGWVNKPFEVMSDTWQEDGSIQLVLRETSPEIWDMDAGFNAADIAPNTNMPVPWGLPEVANLAATTGDDVLLFQADGTVVPRLLVSWTAITDPRITEGGDVEIRCTRMGDDSNTYQTVKALGTDTQAFITGVRAGSTYLITARTGSVVAASPWCPQIVILAGGKSTPPGDVANFIAEQTTGAVALLWDPSTDVDYLETELHLESTWHDATVPLFRGAGMSFLWPWPADGTYTILAKHRNKSGVLSTTATSDTVTVDDGLLVSSGRIIAGAATTVLQATHVSSIFYSTIS